MKLIEQVLHESPTPPRKLDRRIPRDLETIVLKALAKEPGQRYTTAEQMAEDLRRFAADRPILARRITPAERAWRWCKRNPALAGLMAAVATLLVAVALGATLSAFRFRAMSQELEASLYFSDIALAHRSCRRTTSGEPGICSTTARRACGSGNGTTSSGFAGSIRSSSGTRPRSTAWRSAPMGNASPPREGWDHQGPEQPDGRGGPDSQREHRLCPFRGVPPRRQAPGLRGRGPGSEGLGLDDGRSRLHLPWFQRHVQWDGVCRGIQPRRPAASRRGVRGR